MDAARAIWADLGAPAPSLDRLEVSGAPHVLPSAFAVTELAAGAVGAATLAAAAFRGGDRVTVDRRHAAVAFRSERHVEVDGAPPPSPWDAATDYYATADGGLVQTHCNFPHHRAGVLAELGIADPGDEEVGAEIGAAIATREAAALEDALADRGMVASMLRTVAQWDAHPHGQATAALPVVEVLPLGRGPAQPVPGGERPLSGVRVADLTRVIAGPVCGRTLAAYGADVLRIGAPHLPVIGPILADTNLGKRWADLDLRSSDDAATFRGLMVDADVVVQGYRPGGLERLDVGPEALAERRPGIVVATLSAYSHVGPWAPRRGFDSLVQTATGIGAAGAGAAGTEGTRPLPAQALDHGAGWILAAGVMEALRRRATEGGSWLVRTSLLQVRNLLVSLGQVDALGVPDPGGEVDDLCEITGGPAGAVRHVALPGRIDGEATRWSRNGPLAPDDRPVWAG